MATGFTGLLAQAAARWALARHRHPESHAARQDRSCTADRSVLNVEIAHLRDLDISGLRAHWHSVFRRRPPPHLPRHLLHRVLAYRLQAEHLGDLDSEVQRLLDRSGSPEKAGHRAVDLSRCTASLRPGTMLGREWNGQVQRVAVLADGFAWNGKTYPSLSKVAFAITGTRWNGPKFFGLRDKSFQVLVSLLEHPGEVVTREDLRRRLWREEVFVDFDNNLMTNGGIKFYQLTTGINAVTSSSNSNSFKVFPNPAKDEINLQFEKSSTAMVSIEIYDLQGRIVKRFEEMPTVGSNNMSLNIKNLNELQGIYFLHLSSDQLSENQKIIVTK